MELGELLKIHEIDAAPSPLAPEQLDGDEHADSPTEHEPSRKVEAEPEKAGVPN